MRILVTGFGPFLEHVVNPSAIVAEALRSPPDLHSVILPVRFGDSFRRLQQEKTTLYDFVLMLGLAGQASKIRLERVALNLEDSHSPDEGGELRRNSLIDSAGPAARFSDLPLDEWCELLQAEGHEIEVSNHAGTYVCNSIYYRALSEITSPSLFVHLPPLEVLPIERQIHALKKLIEIVRLDLAAE